MLILKNILSTIDKISIILATSLYYGSAAIAQSAPTSPASTPGKLTIVNLDSTKNQTQIQRESRQHILAAQTGGDVLPLHPAPGDKSRPAAFADRSASPGAPRWLDTLPSFLAV